MYFAKFLTQGMCNFLKALSNHTMQTAAVLSLFASIVHATTMRMDYLPLAHVRTDPIVNPTCLSDHIHTYYGPNVTLRPELTYSDMRAANANSGNVEENKSLYWHPAIYMYDRITRLYSLVTTIHVSVYYDWEGATTAFPDGFKMITSGADPKARAVAECVDDSQCLRGETNCRQGSAFFPQTACEELEMSVTFPSCWDGVNLDSDDHMSHVSYSTGSDGSFTEPCPRTHPIKIPEIAFFFRIYNYQGGDYRFSDGSNTVHADYFGGWDQSVLQRVLNTCVNPESDGESFCEDQVTFRDGDKNAIDSAQGWIDNLEPIQPVPSNNPQATVVAEEVTDISTLPRGNCSGVLIPIGPPPPTAPTAPPSPQSASTSPSTQSPTPPSVPPSRPPSPPDLGNCPNGFIRSDRKHKWPRAFNDFVDSVEECAAECDDVDDCTGFTYRNDNSKCMVFRGLDTVECGTMRLCCSRREENDNDGDCPTGFESADVRPNWPLLHREEEPTFADCAETCFNVPECTGFRFRAEDNACRTYAGMDERNCGNSWECCIRS